MTIQELIDELEARPNKDASVFIEMSGDSDFVEVEGVCKYTVTSSPKTGGIALDIGHNKYHHPADAWL